MSNIIQGNDGKHRWVYEMDLYKNPTILIIVLKIFFWIGVGIWAFMVILELFDGYDTWENILMWTKYLAIFLVGWLAFCAMCYYIYALIMGGRYCVLFEMDEEGILHQQMERGAKKSQMISAITALTGLASGNPSTVGTGILAASKTSSYSTFSRVNSIEIFRRRNLIKVKEPLNYNQVYAQDEDFDFVLNYIIKHLSPKAKVKGESTYQII